MNSKIRKLPLLCSLFLSACSPTVDFPAKVSILSDWDADKIIVVIEAFDQWKEATDGLADVSIEIEYKSKDLDTETEYYSDGPLLRFVAVHESDTGLHQLMENSGKTEFLGITNRAHTVVVRQDKLKFDHKLGIIALHEIGHLFGIGDHSEVTNATMYPYTQTPRPFCVDTEAVAKFCELYDCSNRVHSTCY